MKLFSARALVCLAGLLALAAAAQEAPTWDVQALSRIIPGTVAGQLFYDPVTGLWTGTNGIFVHYGRATLTAGTAAVAPKAGEVVADGHVRIESGDMLWVGEHIRYNFLTHQMRSESFRTGKWPVFASG